MIEENVPIRIAVVMGKYVTGGIKSVILNYYTAIDKEKFQFDLIVDKDSADKDYIEFTSQGANVHEVTPINKNPIKNIFDVQKILKANKYGIVHGYLNTLNIFPMFAGFLAGTKVRIAENLSTSHPKEPKTFFKNLLKPVGKMFATHLAANSEYAAEWLYGKKELENVKILRNGLDLNNYRYDFEMREKRRKELHIPDGTFVIGHIGRYQFQKNHSFLIDIFREIHTKKSDTILLLIGYGELKEEIWIKIKEFGLEECVIDGGGSVDNVAYYNLMDCFVLPSYYEGLPVVGIEAQATGLPCVFSSEITRETALIKPVTFVSLEETADAWSEQILRFKEFNRLDTRNELSESGYNIKTEANSLELFYNSLLKQSIID
ncbi:glycosyltransferase [Enterococcus hulanensis]|uniref:glycosyltransferase n=1 Tax=Enterococcus hulanensis TaxID=2559929 RepID=UPI00288D61D4|nr:glycosyltransferase [Enterococcus hulanensis]MDT2660060.1 glycosyltransferase [Enterococcus hulanensis]